MNRLKALSAQAGKNGGSTIVGVLAAMVFVGVVVGVMVKNTGSQSAVSQGYGTAMAMQSTVHSGAVATESFFLNKTDAAKNIIDTLVNTGVGKYVFGSGAYRTALSASSEQYFYSKASGAFQDNLTASGGDVKAGFLIGAGRNASGKDMRTARAFYRFDNLMKVTEGDVGAQNAVFSASKIENADAGMAVTGKATFLGAVSFQNAKTAIFDSAAYFGDTVKFPSSISSILFKGKAYFRKYAEFDKKAVFKDSAYFVNTVKFMDSVEFDRFARFDKKASFKTRAIFNASARFEDSAVITSTCAKFYGETYFKKYVEFQTCAPEFYHRVGFDGGANGKINLNGSVIMESKLDAAGNAYDVFINAKFLNAGDVVIKGTGVSDHDLNYSSNFNTFDLNKCTNFDSLKLSPSINTTVTTASSFKMKSGDAMYIPTDSSRRDPQMTAGLTPIYAASEASGGSVVIYNAATVMGGSTFNIAALKIAYKNAQTDRSTLYKGKYMVIEVTSSIGPPSSDPGIFDANIIYIIKSGGTLDMGTKFYSSSDTSTASTLIYVDKGDAKLEQFGTSGNFRGFIYIASDNTAANSLKFPGSGKIIGAIHNFSSNPLGWNTGVSGYSIPIEFNKDVINDFASLYPSSTGGAPSVSGEIAVKDGGIKVKPLGVYFY